MGVVSLEISFCAPNFGRNSIRSCFSAENWVSRFICAYRVFIPASVRKSFRFGEYLCVGVSAPFTRHFRIFLTNDRKFSHIRLHYFRERFGKSELRCANFEYLPPKSIYKLYADKQSERCSEHFGIIFVYSNMTLSIIERNNIIMKVYNICKLHSIFLSLPYMFEIAHKAFFCYNEQSIYCMQNLHTFI